MMISRPKASKIEEVHADGVESANTAATTNCLASDRSHSQADAGCDVENTSTSGGIYGIFAASGLVFGTSETAAGIDVAVKYACGTSIDASRLGAFPSARAMAGWRCQVLGRPHIYSSTTICRTTRERALRNISGWRGRSALSRVVQLISDESHRRKVTRHNCQKAFCDKINQVEALSAIDLQQAPRPKARQSPSRLRAVPMRR